MGEVGERGDLGVQGEVVNVGDRGGGSPGDNGDDGDGEISSSGGEGDTLIIGGTSTLRDLDDPRGEGDRERRERRFEKLPLFERGIWDLLSRFTFWKFESEEKEKSLAIDDFLEQQDSDETADTPEVNE